MDLEQLGARAFVPIAWSGMARTERQGIEAGKQTRPGLVLADIQPRPTAARASIAANEFLQDFTGST
jgi:hypothetical protein